MLPFLPFFSLRLPSYALFIFLGTLAGLILFFLRLPRAHRKPAVSLVVCIALGALTGAKLLYLLTMPKGTPPAQALLFGFVFHGGLVGGMAAGLATARILRLPVPGTADCAAPCVAIGHGIGRIGCFCAGCCYGIPVSWGLIMPEALGAPHDVPLLPIQLFEAGLNLLLGLMLLCYSRKRHEPGYTAGFYCLAYAIIRFVLEFFRGDVVRGFAAGLSTGQWMSLGLAAIGLLLFARVSTMQAELTNVRLVLRLHPLSCPIPLRVTAILSRDAQNRLRLDVTAAGRRIPFPHRKRPSAQTDVSKLLHTLKPPQVRLLSVKTVVRIPNDAAATAQATGLLRAALNILCVRIRCEQGEDAPLRVHISPSFGDTPSSLHLQAALSFRTLNLLAVLWTALHTRRSKQRADEAIF